MSRDWLLKILWRIGCLPRMHSMVKTSHENTNKTVHLIRETSEAYPVNSRVRQSCVLTSPSLGLFFFSRIWDCTNTKTDDKLFKFAHWDKSCEGFHLQVTVCWRRSSNDPHSFHSLDVEVSRRISKAEAVMALLRHRVWNNKLLTQNTRMCVYQASSSTEVNPGLLSFVMCLPFCHKYAT